MKIVLWIGSESNQKALANKINEVFPVTAIITEKRKSKRKLSLSLVFEKIIEKIFLSSVGNAWWNMLQFYHQKYPKFPDTKMLEVENINSTEAFEFTKRYEPDLILVSGTRLVKEKMLSLSPALGILNLHTGLSPYVKGGPNCTNWCIAKNDFHLIGNTIMWIDKGIDTGNILTTDFTSLNGDENLNEVHYKVMEHAHFLYVEAVKYLSKGHKQSVKQSDIAKGVTYYTKDWTLGQKFRLLKNFANLKKETQSGEIQIKRKGIRVVNLVGE